MEIYRSWLYIFWFLHQTTTYRRLCPFQMALYIFWFLHQTTTILTAVLSDICCISFDSYIKPQRVGARNLSGICCISFDFYIKPQPLVYEKPWLHVVYLLIPTSNHNCFLDCAGYIELYIFWFLHQTTTYKPNLHLNECCISFDSYIKPQRN